VIKSSFIVSDDQCGVVATIGPIYSDYADVIAKLEYLVDVAGKIFKKIMNISKR
jgi:transcriptional regulator of heat shock response